MTEVPSLAEVLAAVVVLAGLGLSCWALIDDAWDLYHVYRFGEVGGPRWVSAMEHFLFNGTLLVGWVMMLGLVSIAIYLPARPDQPTTTLSDWAGWLRFGFIATVLGAQVHRRVGRLKLRNLPLQSWERMLMSMFDGLTVEQRDDLTTRLLRATTAGRELGHAVRNQAQLPMAVLDEIARDEALSPDRRAEAAAAVAALDRMIELTRPLHADIRAAGGITS